MGKIDKAVDKIENKYEKWKRRVNRVLKCGIGWVLISILILIVGIVLLAYFAEYIPTDVWQRGVGIGAIAIVLVSILGIVIGSLLIFSYCYAFQRVEKQMNSTTNTKYTPDRLPSGSYPKQPMCSVDSGGHPADTVPPANPTAPPQSSGTLEEIKVSENVRF